MAMFSRRSRPRTARDGKLRRSAGTDVCDPFARNCTTKWQVVQGMSGKASPWGLGPKGLPAAVCGAVRVLPWPVLPRQASIAATPAIGARWSMCCRWPSLEPVWVPGNPYGFQADVQALLTRVDGAEFAEVCPVAG